MDVALAVLSLVATVTLAVIAVWLLVHLGRTIVELRRITVGLHSTLHWAVGRIPDPAAPGALDVPRGPSD